MTAGSPPAGLESEDSAVHDLLARAVEAFGPPGAALAVIDGHRLTSCVAGVAEISTGAPVGERTLFRAGSVSKTFTATLAVLLSAAGELRLDRPVRDYIPDFRVVDEEASAAVTLDHVLRHNGGWFDGVRAPRPGASIAEAVQSLRNCPQIRPPGTEWSYSNSGFVVAGRVIEVVTGMPYDQAVTDLLLRPLGMHDTYPGATMAPKAQLAAGHVCTAAGEMQAVPTWGDPACGSPAAGVVTTHLDMARFIDFLLHPEHHSFGGNVLTQTHTAALHLPLRAGESVAMSWFSRVRSGLRLAHIAGGVAGYASYLIFAPDHDFAIVVLTNMSGHALHRAVIRELLLGRFGIDDRVQGSPRALSDLSEYEGRYSAYHQTLDIRCHDGGLQLNTTHAALGVAGPEGQPPPEPMHALFHDTDRFVVDSGLRVGLEGEFLRGQDGSVAWLRFPTVLFERSETRDCD